MKRGPGTLARRIATWRFALGRDRRAIVRFLRPQPPRRWALLRRVLRCTDEVRGYHTLEEILTVGEAILARPGARVVECGVGYGASTAKLSILVDAVGGHLDAYDTFRGMPANDEHHRHLDGRPTRFREGAFKGTLSKVQRVLEACGEATVVDLHKGLIEDTLVTLEGPVDVALIDVDLTASTRTCLLQLLPRLAPGGVLFSQDGHLEGTVDLLADPAFWRQLGSQPPQIPGLGQHKLLRIAAADLDWLPNKPTTNY